MSADSGEPGDAPPQLQIWENAGRTEEVEDLTVDGEIWKVQLLVERAAHDLFRGRLAFRSGEESFVTAAVLVEESEEAVVQRATTLPEAMVRQFFVSARD